MRYLRRVRQSAYQGFFATAKLEQPAARLIRHLGRAGQVGHAAAKTICITIHLFKSAS
jgi:hypothetical protein